MIIKCPDCDFELPDEIGKQFARKQGSKGGKKTLKKYGKKHFSTIRKMNVLKIK